MVTTFEAIENELDVAVRFCCKSDVVWAKLCAHASAIARK